jgi:type II secretion system protein I
MATMTQPLIVERRPAARFDGEGRSPELGFTLLEVMIAVAIFFTALFAILQLVTQNVRAAHSLQQRGPTAGMVAAEFSMRAVTNKLEEGMDEGDFGDLYPGYRWLSETLFFASNGLYQVDFVVFRDSEIDSTLSILMFDPKSGPGPKRGALR